MTLDWLLLLVKVGHPLDFKMVSYRYHLSSVPDSLYQCSRVLLLTSTYFYYYVLTVQRVILLVELFTHFFFNFALF